jgi:hypothetical protein
MRYARSWCLALPRRPTPNPLTTRATALAAVAWTRRAPGRAAGRCGAGGGAGASRPDRARRHPAGYRDRARLLRNLRRPADRPRLWWRSGGRIRRAAWPRPTRAVRWRSFRARRRCRKPRGGGQRDRPRGKRCPRRSRLARAARPWRRWRRTACPGAAVMLARCWRPGAAGAGPRRARAWRCRGGARRSHVRCAFWAGCSSRASAARGREAGLASLERAALAGNGAAATDLGLLHGATDGLPPDPRPRATGSNGAAGGRWLGRHPSRAAAGRRGR